MKDKLLFSFRVILFMLGFLLVAYATIAFGEYLGEFRNIYFMKGQWDKAIALVVITLGIGYVLRKLLISLYRKEAGITRRRKK
ncbi:hypothetical protein KKG83_04875 [Candidatus Micrarchaeota archaeon]|nr:hypothetical protein [Candidatus Micrarchaeota archaeon]MBU2476779.1 hypothetical protein [Candidatus Micrarchaeota archaeon]